MILADRFLDYLSQVRTVAAQGFDDQDLSLAGKHVQATPQQLRSDLPRQIAKAKSLEVSVIGAHRFVVSREVLALAGAIPEASVLRDRSTAFLPGACCWLEWETDAAGAESPPASGAMTGLLLDGEEGRDLRKGNAMMVVAEPGRPLVTMTLSFALEADPPVTLLSDAHLRAMGGSSPTPAMTARFGTELLRLLAAINSPRIVRFEDGPDLTRLNRKRGKAHRTPFLTWRTVRINLDEKVEHLGQPRHYSGRMPLHFTRSHLRRIGGEWRLVRAYWSGDAKHGRILKTYKVGRKSDFARGGDRQPVRQIVPPRR